MVLSIFVGLVFVQGYQEEPYLEPPSLYQAIVVRPTGKNGYEDYLKGIDQLRADGAMEAISSTDSADPNRTYLQGERGLAERFARFLGNVRAGMPSR